MVYDIVSINTLRPRQNGRHFTDDISKCILLDIYVWISIKISLKFVHMGPINNIPSLVQIMDWRRPGDKPLFEPMMVRLLTHVCVTRPQWVKEYTSAVRDLMNFFVLVRYLLIAILSSFTFQRHARILWHGQDIIILWSRHNGRFVAFLWPKLLIYCKVGCVNFSHNE